MSDKRKGVPPLRARFLEVAEQRRLAPHTLEAYTRWIKEFIKFHHPRNPTQLGTSEIASFLTFLVSKRGVSASTQHLALNAVVFLFRYVLNKDIGDLPHIPRALRRTRKNSALTRTEFMSLLSHIPENLKVVFLVMYGCGLRITEASNLRMKDLLWDEDLIVARNTKARGDRAVRMPTLLRKILFEHVRSRRQWQLKLEKKRQSNMSKVKIESLVSATWSEQYVFVGNHARYDEGTKAIHMRPLSPSFLQRVFKLARNAAKLSKPVTPHSLRYSYATEAAAAGNNIAELQITLGHKDPNTTARYIDVERTIMQVASPLDTLNISVRDEVSANTSVEAPKVNSRGLLRDIFGTLFQLISSKRDR